MGKKILKYVLIFGSVMLVIAFVFEFIKYQKNKPLCKNCNVLLISIDTLSAKHLPCYGYDKDTTPNLCQFGKDNILFSNSYSQSSWTRPSQTSVVTGLHVSTHGVETPLIDKLSPKYQTIAQTLKANDYKTYYYGPDITGYSWDESVFSKGFDINAVGKYSYTTPSHWYDALEVLKANIKKNKQPTFMFLHTYYPHVPYSIDQNENGSYKFIDKNNINKYPNVPLVESEIMRFTPELKQYVVDALTRRVNQSLTSESKIRNQTMLTKIKATNNLKEAKIQFDSFGENEKGSYSQEWYFELLRSVKPNDYVESLYDERIYQMDKYLELFFNKIDKEFSKNTIVVLYSDHGETLGERGSYGHCQFTQDCLYNETVRVPLIIKIPGVKPKQISEIVQGIDIYPTIMGIIGKTYPEYLEGENLTDLISGKTTVNKKNYVVSERDYQKVVMDKKWKAYFKDYNNTTLDKVELYDLENDLYEQKNVAKENPDILKIKIDQLNEFMNKSKTINHIKNNFPDWIDEVKKAKLIKEGYF